MILNEAMVDILHAIRRNENVRNNKRLNVNADNLGNSLIDLYYRSYSLQTRELIREFMDQAGPVWLRKLLTKDTDPISSTKTQFASLQDYVGLLAANDPAACFGKTA